MVTTVTDALMDALVENRCEVHGPVSASHTVALVVERAIALAGGSLVAVSPGDPLMLALGVIDELRAAGGDLLLPDDSTWDARLPEAGVGVTGARLAVAATGSMLLGTGAGMPRATSLVPRTHLCVVRTEDVVATMSEGIARLAETALPSAIAWIGGPSRTGDLEMLTTFGVHGPIAVEVVLVAGLELGAETPAS